MPAYFELDLELIDVEPRVWRRVLLPKKGKVADLAFAVIDACDWSGRDPQAILKGQPVAAGAEAGLPAGEHFTTGGMMPPPDDPWETRLADFLKRRPKGTAISAYGRRAQWWVSVTQRAVRFLDEAFPRRLLAGERSFPRESFRDLDEYRMCAEYARTGTKPRGLPLRLVDRIGHWHPDRFNLGRTKRVFDRGARTGFLPEAFRSPEERERLVMFLEDLEPRPLRMFDHAVIGAAIARGARAPWHSVVACPPDRGEWDCPALVHVWLDPETSQAGWRCGMCGREGLVTDMTGVPVEIPEVEDITARDDCVHVTITPQQHHELLWCELKYRETHDVVAGAELRGEDVVLSAPRERMRLFDMVLGENICDARGDRLLRLEDLRDRIETALY